MASPPHSSLHLTWLGLILSLHHHHSKPWTCFLPALPSPNILHSSSLHPGALGSTGQFPVPVLSPSFSVLRQQDCERCSVPSLLSWPQHLACSKGSGKAVKPNRLLLLPLSPSFLTQILWSVAVLPPWLCLSVLPVSLSMQYSSQTDPRPHTSDSISNPDGSHSWRSSPPVASRELAWPKQVPPF